MSRFTRFRSIYIFLIIMVSISLSLTPCPTYAWSAVTVVDEGTLFILQNFFRAVISFFTGKEVPQNVIKDVGTHQLMMKLAYKLLEKDPAYIDQKEYFPTISGILEWEGVAAKTDRVIMQGGEWRGRNSKSGGPDAAGKSKDSYHYLNPRLEEGKCGNADIAVERYFKDFMMQMYGQGDFSNRDKPNDDTNHNAAWAAHYLGDTYVPYHTVGRFKKGMQIGKLSSAEAGPAYLYDFMAAELAGTSIKPESIVPAPDWSGLDNDFSDVYLYYSKYLAVADKDWFDPWYYNGPYWSNKIRAGPNLVLGSHQSWESWAHGYITGNNLAQVPTAYSKDWKNAKPGFNLRISNIENQAAMARAFAIASAKETAANMAVFTKKPDLAFNKAAQSVATLWRASITALRPEIKVTPDAGTPKLLKVTATIRSVEPNDPATNVKAKLTVTGGAIRGVAIHDPVHPVTVTSDRPWITEWQVDSNNPSACTFELEAIGEYENIPDLQYAFTKGPKSVSGCKARRSGGMFHSNDLDNLLPSLKATRTTLKEVRDQAGCHVMFPGEGLTVTGRIDISGQWDLEGRDVSTSEHITAFQTQDMALRNFQKDVKSHDEGDYKLSLEGAIKYEKEGRKKPIRDETPGRVEYREIRPDSISIVLIRQYKCAVVWILVYGLVRSSGPVPPDRYVNAQVNTMKVLETKAIKVIDEAME